MKNLLQVIAKRLECRKTIRIALNIFFGVAVGASVSSEHGMAAEVRSHRGNLWGHPEHTLESYAAVIKAGAQVIELDVQMSADRVPICLHDATIDRTTDKKGLAASLTWDELQLADAGIKFNPKFIGRKIPSLRSSLEFLKTQRARVLIEPKVNETEAIIAAIQAADFPEDRISILLYTPGSTSPSAALTQYVALKPNYAYWLVSGGTPTSLGSAYLSSMKLQGWDGLSFWPNTFSADDFLLAHNHGLQVGVYGVDAGNVLKYVRDGADLLLTDNPGILANSLMEGFITATYTEFATKYSLPELFGTRGDDADGDGLSNIEELSYQTDPMAADSIPISSLPILSLNSSAEEAILTVSMPAQSMETLWMKLEQSSDLVVWTEADPNVIAEDHTEWPLNKAWKFKILLDANSSTSRAFFRVKPLTFPRP
jgi:glycerophosphoryl diester phosphodiesterase